jgi:hypothetical protein
MIRNNEELAIVREQIQRLLSALASLKREAGPQGERQFHVLAEGCVDMLAELQGDVEDFVNSAAGHATEDPGRSVKTALRSQGAA